MATLSKTRKRAMLEEPGGTVCCLAEYDRCVLPNIPMTLQWGDAFATFEHLVPVSAGGGDGADNVKLSHYKCNHRRADERLQGE